MRLTISPRIALLIIFSIFVLPLLLAWLMYADVIEFKPGSTRNFGQLLRPPIPADWQSSQFVAGTEAEASPTSVLAEHWVVLYALPENCNEPCLQRVVDLRQIHRASGRHQPRIRLALLLPPGLRGTTSAELLKIYDKFHLLENPDNSLWEALSQATSKVGALDQATATIYLLDPLGNVMMRYPVDSDPNDLKSDLDRLMTWSKQDEQQ